MSVVYPWSNNLVGKIALVTGASRGVGKGISLVLGEAGATVYVTGRSVRGKPTTQDLLGTIEDTADEVTARGGIGIPIKCDHTNDEDIKHLVSVIKTNHGHIDILVNNAFGGEEGKQNIVTYDGFSFWEHDFTEWWHRMFTAYLRSTMVTTYYACPLLLNQGGALVVNTLWWNRERYLCDLFFDVASAGVGRMVYGLALELKSKGITTIAVSPGWTRTERMTDVPAEVLQRETNSPEFVGRGIVSLAMDPDILKKTGTILEIGALAKEYGFTDIDGKVGDYHAKVEKQPPHGWPQDKL